MKSSFIIVITTLLLLFVSRNLFAERSYNPRDVLVTRWLDSTTTPITYDEYNSSRNFAFDANITAISLPFITDDIAIEIIVNEDLYPLIETPLDTFFMDLRQDGYSLNIYTAAETQSPAALRDHLLYQWQNAGIEGVIFIGDLAVPWYEMDEPSDWGGEHVMFACDLYFMDLDGDWGDSDYDGMFDSHTGQNMYADIWCGRLKTSNLYYHQSDEVSRMTNYFRKNHQYRIGNLRLDDHALAFIDNDWHEYGWENDVRLSYSNTNAITDIYETCRTNYIDQLEDQSNNRYEHVLICSHSSPSSHYIYYNNYAYEQFYNIDIENYMMQSLYYNLFACSNARYVETDNMGAWYAFESDFGLLSIGSSKTGSMLCFEDFYLPLGNGTTFGEAFLYWAQLDIESCAEDQSRPWFYGMCIIGDPTLKLSRFQPPLQYCSYIPGDINGDGQVIGGDITYGVQYFRGIGAPPPDSCYDYENERWVYVAADANGNCEFLGSDITYMVRYFRGVYDSVGYCPNIPPPEE